LAGFFPPRGRGAVFFSAAQPIFPRPFPPAFWGKLGAIFFFFFFFFPKRGPFFSILFRGRTPFSRGPFGTPERGFFFFLFKFFSGFFFFPNPIFFPFPPPQTPPQPKKLKERGPGGGFAFPGAPGGVKNREKKPVLPILGKTRFFFFFFLFF